MFARLRRQVRYALHGAERARLLREEMEAHLEMKAQELMEDGMEESEARQAARRQFGNLTLAQEEARSVWIARWASDLAQDARFAMRGIRRRPGFAAVASLSAALGIGACSLIFGVANFALFRPLPVADPARLLSISGMNLRSGKTGSPLTYPDFEDLRRASSFEDLAACFNFLPAAISAGGEPQRHWGAIVTANYFDVVRPPMLVGRGFDAARDGRPGGPPVVVLSHQLWRTRFGGDPFILGRDIELNGRPVQVIGVAGPGFRGTEGMFYSDFWLPFSMLDRLAHAGLDIGRLQDRGGQWLTVAARLRQSVSEKAAAAEITALGERLRAAYPATNKDRAFHVERAGQANPGLRKLASLFFLLLLGAAALVLLTACANVANLLLARASARRHEIATRLAIGAGRFRLVRQLLVESVALALLGGAGGYAIARLGAAALGNAGIPLSVPVDLAVTLDHRVLLFCIGLSVLTGVVFGLAPALRATRPGLAGALSSERAGTDHERRFGLRSLLVAAQAAVCMTLLIASGLFLRSFLSAGRIDPGFTHRNLLLLGFDPGLNPGAAEERRRAVDAVLENARAIPGVESAALSTGVPLSTEGTQNAFLPEDGAADLRPIPAEIYAVSPGFFETLGIRLLDGEDFPSGVPAQDIVIEDIVIANQALAARAFPGQNPLGRRIRYQGRLVRIAGLAATAKSRTIGEDPRPCLYFPLAREARGNDSLTGIALLLRTAGAPAAYAQRARQAIRQAGADLAVFDVRTMDAHLERALYVPRAAAWLFGIAGAMGALIAAIGLYGVVSFAVARRTREIGIRMALGARRAQVVARVLRQGLLLAGAGALIGLGLALALGRLARMLYGVSPTDAVTLLLAPVLLVLVALVACLAPARRAASLDPVRALRSE